MKNNQTKNNWNKQTINKKILQKSVLVLIWFWQSDVNMTSDGHEVPTCAFEETWISIQRFKRHICCKFQVAPKWVPRKSLTKHFFAQRSKAYYSN